MSGAYISGKLIRKLIPSGLTTLLVNYFIAKGHIPSGHVRAVPEMLCSLSIVSEGVSS